MSNTQTKRPLRAPVFILMGPPGAGKSTISEHIAGRLPLITIASGKRLRAEIAAGTAIGREIDELLAAGHFAPDSLMDRLMRQWLAAVPDSHIVLLDGFPRSTAQALALEGILADLQRPLAQVIALRLSPEEAIRRLGGRRVCTGGGEPFTLHISDVEAMRRCWARGGELQIRADDRSEIIEERLRVYDQETRPLLDFYERSRLVHSLDAHGASEEVSARVLSLITDNDSQLAKRSN